MCRHASSNGLHFFSGFLKDKKKSRTRTGARERTKQGKTKQGKTNKTRRPQGKTTTRQNKTRHDTLRQDKTKRDKKRGVTFLCCLALCHRFIQSESAGKMDGFARNTGFLVPSCVLYCLVFSCLVLLCCRMLSCVLSSSLLFASFRFFSLLFLCFLFLPRLVSLCCL
jgi:hypothetical protein